jgi:hypothetical protein
MWQISEAPAHRAWAFVLPGTGDAVTRRWPARTGR